MKDEHPEYRAGDVAKELGRRWTDASPEIKSKYEALVEKDRAFYEKEMTVNKKRNNRVLEAAVVPEPDDEKD